MKAITPVAGLLFCKKCGAGKLVSEFNRDRTYASGRARTCKACKRSERLVRDARPEQKEKRRALARIRSRRPEEKEKQARYIRSTEGKLWRMVHSARDRAREKGLPFEITARDLVMPSHCPLLGIPIEPGRGKLHANSPSLDRLRPELGYVQGNVAIISYRANAIKHDATPEELEQIAANLRALLSR